MSKISADQTDLADVVLSTDLADVVLRTEDHDLSPALQSDKRPSSPAPFPFQSLADILINIIMIITKATEHICP